MHQDWKSVGSYSTVGLEFAFSVILGLLVGQWLDNKLSTDPWMTGLWSLFGLIAGGRAVYRALVKANRAADEEDRKLQEQRRKYFDDE